MGNKGLTLVELLIVIVVMAIIAGFTITSVGNIIKNTQDGVDEQNAIILENALKQAYYNGDIEIVNNKFYNTISDRSYVGTGGWFFEDLAGYIDNRVEPQAEIAQNNHNKNGNFYRFYFRISGDEVTIFYWDEDKTAVDIRTFTLD